MSIQADVIKHRLTQLLEHGNAKGAGYIGLVEELQGVVKMTDSPKIFDAIVRGDFRYPHLLKRQYLVACVDNGLNIRVWGVYTSSQIEAMELYKTSFQVKSVEWKILEMSEELEAELRERINTPPTSAWECTIL
jgi:hypothetical protein